MKTLSLTVALIFALLAPEAHAGNEQQAKVLFFSGNRLLKRGSYAKAVQKYRAAYAQMPNPKILRNMAIAMELLGHHVRAANTYAKFLKSPDRDARRIRDVKSRLSRLEGSLSRLTISVSSPGAVVHIDGDKVDVPADGLTRRVRPGYHMVRASKPGYRSAQLEVRTAGAEVRPIELTLVRIVVQRPAATTVANPRVAEPLALHKRTSQRPSNVGMYLRTDIDGNSFGRGAVLTGALTYNVNQRLQLGLGGIVGASPGIYAGASLAFTAGRVRPIVLAGVPIQFADQTLVGIHGAVGLHVSLGRRFGVLATAGVEYFVNAPTMLQATVFVPSIGLTAGF